MNSMNTINVGQEVNNSSGVQVSSEQHGLIGPGSNLKDDDFFDQKPDDGAKSRKAKITDVLENEDEFPDTGGKKPVVAKKKKKKVVVKKKKQDGMLDLPEDGNESWDSSRGNAHVVDLSEQVPPGTSQGYNASYNRNMQHLNLNSSQLKPATLSNSGSAAQLTVQDALNNIEDAVDLSARGSAEGISPNRSQIGTSHVAANHLRLSGANPNHSAMMSSYQANHPQTSGLNMMTNEPPKTAFNIMKTENNLPTQGSNYR